VRTTSRALRVALIGCGKIADQHVHAIRRIANCEIVAVCDRELLMAQQLAERFGIKQCFSDVGELLRTAAPEVVHITTPPQSHFALAKQCLSSGCHVYVEKPFALTADESGELLELAGALNLKVTAGHNLQFTLESQRMRELVRAGYLGGRPVHLESHFTYDLGDTSYAAAMIASQTHWVRQLPGRLFHNIVSHGIAALAEFLDDEVEELTATASQSERLRRLGVNNVLDELRVFIRDASGTTAFFCFSTQIKPGLNQLRICGPVNSIIVDHVTGSLIRNKGRAYKSYLTYFLPPLIKASEQLRNSTRNIADFLRRRLYQDSGMKELIERFYSSIRLNTPPPIPYREIILTARIMDEIFAQIYPQGTNAEKLTTEMLKGKLAEAEKQKAKMLVS
jgi:predicted dehydrogenase